MNDNTSRSSSNYNLNSDRLSRKNNKQENNKQGNGGSG